MDDSHFRIEHRTVPAGRGALQPHRGRLHLHHVPGRGRGRVVQLQLPDFRRKSSNDDRTLDRKSSNDCRTFDRQRRDDRRFRRRLRQDQHSILD